MAATTDSRKRKAENDGRDETRAKIGPSIKRTLFLNVLKTLPPLSEPTMKVLRELDHPPKITEKQALAISLLLEGKSIIGLDVRLRNPENHMFIDVLIPIVELLYRIHSTPCKGTSIIIICETRGIAIRIHAMAKKLLKYHSATLGLVVGASPVKRGNLLIATHECLLEHLKKTRGTTCTNLKCLVIFGASRTMELNDEDTFHQLKRILPKSRQRAIFAERCREKVIFLHRLSFQRDEVWIDMDYGMTWASGGLRQYYTVVSSEKRFLGLYSFMKREQGKKIIVYFSSDSSVKFYSKLLKCIHMDSFVILGDEELQKRKKILSNFTNVKQGMLLCTASAAFGLGIPAVDWLVQYDFMDGSEEACLNASPQRTLFFLREQEIPFLRPLQAERVFLRRYILKPSEINLSMQHKLVKLVADDHDLLDAAEDAYEAYMSTYSSHPRKDIYNIGLLDPHAVAASFCLPRPPVLMEYGMQRYDIQQDICSKLERFSVTEQGMQHYKLEQDICSMLEGIGMTEHGMQDHELEQDLCSKLEEFNMKEHGMQPNKVNQDVCSKLEGFSRG